MSQSSGETDWLEWHRPYDVDGSALHTRLRLVQARLRAALDACAPGPIRLISACAGQGRDVVPVLAGHPRRVDVRAWLVELDPRNADIARAAIEASALSGVEVVTGDASNTSAYEGMVPADIVLFCGIWGNVTDADVARSIELLPMLCAHEPRRCCGRDTASNPTSPGRSGSGSPTNDSRRSVSTRRQSPPRRSAPTGSSVGHWTTSPVCGCSPLSPLRRELLQRGRVVRLDGHEARLHGAAELFLERDAV